MLQFVVFPFAHRPCSASLKALSLLDLLSQQQPPACPGIWLQSRGRAGVSTQWRGGTPELGRGVAWVGYSQRLYADFCRSPETVSRDCSPLCLLRFLSAFVPFCFLPAGMEVTLGVLQKTDRLLQLRPAELGKTSSVTEGLFPFCDDMLPGFFRFCSVFLPLHLQERHLLASLPVPFRGRSLLDGGAVS